MDAVSGLLDGPHARGAFLLRSLLSPPWSMRIADEAPLTLLAVLRGSAWLVLADGGTARIGAGDVALVRGPQHYTVADQPSTPPQVTVGPGQRCTPVGPGTGMTELGTRAWGNDAAGGTVLLTGTYARPGAVGERLVRALPPLVAVPADEGTAAVTRLLAAEVAREAPGQEAVLDRLLDVALVSALRVWAARPEARAPGWYVAAGDPVVGPALTLIHDRPAEPWTVASLADAVGVARATLARRFTELVGEPPMGYLTSWRIALATDLLRDRTLTLSGIARRVGYASPFALSTAFKRATGVSPAAHRATLAG
ncbi:MULTISPECIES: AraC family transcriptional regulator [unclassified Modestobacter]|uniref:AraC family transcriptional regulator n=1 Tax=unclassified Modestobacter TaxID=2643866 RepID=UPI0022AA5EB2|nr:MULTISPECIES: AraC family transcriptional regulator [unclassified Modestobacter]MCZ2827100.1 AraC family transcriptional regulator [Modestobacter sp. VKM Ac-2981]MCZ2854351.1 AraC family transcriptional regulator [Modestobacter sp. VKM Ac-2982]